ncbi:tol protein [Stagonosporopsis vannaccii]|nr:tol protein [Stagonosporopsis vannaccii]
MRSRPDDKYVAGMWISSLPQDLSRYCASWEMPEKRPDITVPSWSWASVAEGVSFPKGLVSIARVIDVSYCSVGPPQLGHASGASIVLQGHSFTAAVRLSHEQLRTSRFIKNIDLTDLKLFTERVINEWNISQDYQLLTKSQPGDVVVDISIASLNYTHDPWRRWFGLVLREVSPSVHERVCICDVYQNEDIPWVLRKARFQDNLDIRINQQAILALPVRSFKII